jgi:hypothetical protein
MDSIAKDNKELKVINKHLSDSIEAVILLKEQTTRELTAKLERITVKYIPLKNQTPDRDTVIKYVELYTGKECLEKLPVLECKIVNYEKEIEDYRNLVIQKNTYNIELQKNFDELLIVGKQVTRDLKSAVLQLTSSEIIDMIEEFGIEEDIPKPTIISELQRLGYTYEPIEYNEKIQMKWLIGSTRS